METSDKINESEMSKKREEYQVQIRKQNRENQFKKQRNFNPNFGEDLSKNDLNLNLMNNNITQELKDLIKICLAQTYKMTDFPELALNVKSNDLYKQHKGVIGIRKILSVDNPPIQPIIDENLVPYFIQFMQRDDQIHLQLEAAWALTNVASGETHQTQTIIDKGGIPLFVKLLSSPSMEVSEQAIWAIGNIAGDSASYRDMILRAGGLKPLCNLISKTDFKNAVKHGTWALSNIIRSKPIPDFSLVSDALPVICQVIKEQNDQEILVDSLWALSYLSDGDEQTIQRVINCQVVPTLVKLFNFENIQILIPITRILGNIATGNDEQTNVIIASGALFSLHNLLNHPKKSMKREVCWSLSNITAGNSDQAGCVLKNQQLVYKLMELAKSEDVEIRREAIWVISNSTKKGKPEDIYKLVEYGIIDLFLSLLGGNDVKTLLVVLEGIKNVLTVGKNFYTCNDENLFLTKLENLNGAEILENLQTHPNNELYKQSLNILETFFEIEDPL